MTRYWDKEYIVFLCIITCMFIVIIVSVIIERSSKNDLICQNLDTGKTITVFKQSYITRNRDGSFSDGNGNIYLQQDNTTCRKEKSVE